jgi:hypothetical protein
MLLVISRSNISAFAAALVAIACLRLCFAGVLLSDEDYHMAAAIHILQGQVPYRDFWYDKPPLSALYYLPIGAVPGIVLRLWDAAYILLCCFLAFRLARTWWSEAEGRVAALLVAFFTTFYLPSAVIPFAPDALLLAPHLAAIYFARQQKALLAGLICGIGFWINVKAVFVLVACSAWAISSILGFAALVAAGALLLSFIGALPGYWEQVWVWGFAYAAGSPVGHPFLLALERVGNWVGFHVALALSWLAGSLREQRDEQLKLLIWLAASFAAVCFGNHFAPRYFLQLLPPLVIVGARGITTQLKQRPQSAAITLAVLLVVPIARFGPRYPRMTYDKQWSDIALDLDSQQVAERINRQARPEDTLFVWGYRPDIYVYTRLPLAGKFWDSQPLTGIAADRHLSAETPIANQTTTAHLQAVERSRPTFFVDGLGLLNNKLAPDKFAEMRLLLSGYREIARTRLSVIYRRD